MRHSQRCLWAHLIYLYERLQSQSLLAAETRLVLAAFPVQEPFGI